MDAHLLSLNNFNMPKVCTAADSAYVHLVYLLLLDKGKIQSHPNMGVGLRTIFENNNSSNILAALNDEIMYQVNTFLPELSAIRVSTGITRGHDLGILVETDGGVYAIGVNDTGKINIADEHLLEELLN